MRDVSTSVDMTSREQVTTGSDKIVVALDVPTGKEALALVEQLRDQISFFKVGLQLFTAAGPELVREVVENGSKVFLDLKLHDIPSTVAKAVESAVKLSVDMLTIHLSGGETMIRAAVEAANKQVMVLGVTVLTNHTDETLNSIGVSEALEKHVLRLADLGMQCGVGGLVASPREAASLRRQFRENIRIVTPGIRPSWAATGDQKRVTTPRAAIEAGADYLVIGRPITADPNPSNAVERLLAELQIQ
jgi:orotidine-5'-phosphate decarboxylase